MWPYCGHFQLDSFGGGLNWELYHMASNCEPLEDCHLNLIFKFNWRSRGGLSFSDDIVPLSCVKYEPRMISIL